jgi:D-cysteine desulfhydrase
MGDLLAAAYPGIGKRLPKLAIADLPTPVTAHRLSSEHRTFDVAVKHDEATSSLYGGNKVRKLEYLLRRAQDRGARRVATFGAAGSNHALATAMHAFELGLDCTCFLSHQTVTPNVARTLNMHRRLGTEIFRWGHGVDQVALFRERLQGRGAWVIPLGGTCWLGAVGFVNAGLELAAQVADGLVRRPDRIYIACGTTGSAAGLALGIAAAGLSSTVHAVQVADNPFASERKMLMLMAKTQLILNRADASFIADGFEGKVVWRDEFLAGGYARVDDATATAVKVANDELGLSLETTYTGKAMAAMLHDLQSADSDGKSCLFWNTYNAQPLPVDSARPADLANIPAEFERYFEAELN